jgi:hypothetical protein
MAIWSVEDAVSASQSSTISNAPTTQTLTGWSAPAQYGWQDVDIPSPLSSCPSLESNISSRESSPLDTPTRGNSIPTSASPVEDATQDFQDIDDFFKDLYQGLSPDWSSVLQGWPDETETFFAQ